MKTILRVAIENAEQRDIVAMEKEFESVQKDAVYFQQVLGTL